MLFASTETLSYTADEDLILTKILGYNTMILSLDPDLTAAGYIGQMGSVSSVSTDFFFLIAGGFFQNSPVLENLSFEFPKGQTIYGSNIAGNNLCHLFFIPKSAVPPQLFF
jgi:hypothetical protein